MAISKLNPIEGGIPKGNTSNRSTEFPSPAVGDVYYNGELEVLEIYNGTAWVANSAPPATPTIATPTDVSATDAYTSTGGKLQVVFTPGSGGGTPNQYNAYTTSGGYSGFDSTSTVVISGLTPGTAYTVYGNAQNNFGTTVNTANAAAVTPTTLPQVRTIGTASINAGTSDITVTWTNGSNGGKNLTSITITPFLNGTTAGTSETASTTSSTSHTFTGLTEGSNYTFKVKATNANGTCADSTATNSVTLPVLVTVDYLVVAGGGGGATANQTGSSEGGGGGGAGGLRSTMNNTGGGGTLESKLILEASTNYTVIVGAGASAITSEITNGNNGTNSVFATITSTGGGGGGRGTNGPGLTGGSGGGGGAGTSNVSGGARTASPVQGNNGGSGAGSARAGGGGGAGQQGGNGEAAGQPGKGGDGVAVSITGTSVTYGGGGAGGFYNGSLANTGGAGGGGGSNTSFTGPGGNGTANLGGGGGGAGGGGNPNYGNGGSGGSGIVILRYPSTKTIAVGAGLTAGVTNQSVGTNEKYTTLIEGSGNVSWS